MAHAAHAGPANDVDMSCARTREPFRCREPCQTWKSPDTTGLPNGTVFAEIRHSGGFPEPDAVVVRACRGVPSNRNRQVLPRGCFRQGR